MKDRPVDFICTDITSLWNGVISQFDTWTSYQFSSIHDGYDDQILPYQDMIQISYLGPTL